VQVVAFGARIVRAVTHMDVTREQCERAASVLVEVIGSEAGSSARPSATER
jgi:hypothetical protein